jgi:hypothetical protein
MWAALQTFPEIFTTFLVWLDGSSPCKISSKSGGRTGIKGAKNGRPKYLQQVRKVILLVVRSEGTRTELPGKIEIDLPASESFTPFISGRSFGAALFCSGIFLASLPFAHATERRPKGRQWKNKCAG